jgi:hypothetical protein
MNTLQHRVDQYLHGKPPEYVLEESETEAVESIFNLLQKAEDDLQAAKERVDRLKWELAKAQS